MDLLQQFINVTNATREVASSLLEACDWNLDLAIEMHLENSHGDEIREIPSGASSGTGVTGRKRRRSGNTGGEGPSRDVLVPSTIPFAEGEEKIRAPIPPKQEVLVPFSEQPGLTRRRSARHARSVFDGFRDFRAEMKAQESGVVTGKRKTLEDLFRPPLDVMFGGSFDEAKSAGYANSKWLLVNIQHTKEFACQTLNRDVWSNPTVKHMLREHFIFWQVYEGSVEGEKYKQFYPFCGVPHIAIIDPRTGERLVQAGLVSSDEFIGIVSDFVAEHDSLQENHINHTVEPSAKKCKVSKSIIDASEESQVLAAIAESLAETNQKKKKSNKANIVSVDSSSDSDSSTSYSISGNETSDDDVVEIDSKMKEPLCAKMNGEKPLRGKGKGKAIVPQSRATRTIHKEVEVDSICNSLDVKKETRHQPTSEASSSDAPDSQLVDNYKNLSLKVKEAVVVDGTRWRDTQETADRVVALQDEKNDVNGKGHMTKDGKSCNILLRYPDGSRKVISLLASEQLAALLRLVESLGFSMSDYELVTQFPRRNLSQVDCTVSLKDAGLCPSETVFIQQMV